MGHLLGRRQGNSTDLSSSGPANGLGLRVEEAEDGSDLSTLVLLSSKEVFNVQDICTEPSTCKDNLPSHSAV